MKPSERQLHEIGRGLGLEFADISLLERALAHGSFVAEFPGAVPESNERLEFLGDSVLDLAVAVELMRRFPDSPEGRLTQMRAALVDKPTLGRVGARLGLGEWLIMGVGEVETGGRERESNLADGFEALVGAALLDAGYERAAEFALRAMAEELESVADMPEPPRHPKSLLHEAAMRREYPPPEYEILESAGPSHAPTFVAQALVNGSPTGVGEGRSKQEAEANAAAAALERLEGD